MLPIIGILGEVDDSLCSTIKNNYVKAIENSGGLPILLPYVNRDEAIRSFVNACDGFLFSGGTDIDPSRYNTEKKETCGALQISRDELEFKVFYQAIKTKKPIMGICRGAQLINVALGGTLFQDIPSELNTNIAHRQTETEFTPSHSVNVLDNTPLKALTAQNVLTANSFHHQAVKALGKGLEIMATADDGVIEATFLNGKRYLRAYQWHPERLYSTDRYNKILFDDFIKNCIQK